MEFGDMTKDPRKLETRISDIYVNTEICNATVESTERSEKEDKHYEQLRLGGRQETRNGSQQENALKRIKMMTYINLSMIIVLYIAVIIVIIITALPKDQVNEEWTQWSLWTPCDVTCGNGVQTRFRTCSYTPPNEGGIRCNGSFVDVSFCGMPACTVSDHRVSFFVKMAEEGVLLGPNQHLVFTKVLNNLENGYNSTTGTFVAPVSGVYLFTYFIEVKNVYGKVDLRLEEDLINSAIAYGRPTEIDFHISGFNHSIVFEAASTAERGFDMYRSINCISGLFDVSGFHNFMTVEPVLNLCPYRDGPAATGGNTALTHLNAGERVWLQTSSDNMTLGIGANTTSFTGILLFTD